MPVSKDPKKIKELLTRGVEGVYPSVTAFEKVLKSGKRLRLYNGIDPTGSQLHLGHTVQLRKLRQFQDLGHEVILLFGSFTAMLGDPTGKDKARRSLTREQVIENTKNYKKEAAKILNFTGPNAAKIKMNHEWLDTMTLRDFVTLSHEVTVPRLLERDMFDRRLKSGGTITMPELIYPLLQGYDSVAMDVDLEVGGSDQMFNMLMGRDLVKTLKHKEKFVLTTPLLVDSNGHKIGKTEGNVIAISDTPDDLYGKIMALGDDSILPVFFLCTDESLEQIAEMERAIKKQKNPRDFKALLARIIVEMYHSKQAAHDAEARFLKMFRSHEAPDDVEVIKLKKQKWDLLDLLVETKLVSSKSEARRLLAQGGIKIAGVAAKEDCEVQLNKKGIVFQRGKRQFVSVKC